MPLNSLHERAANFGVMGALPSARGCIYASRALALVCLLVVGVADKAADAEQPAVSLRVANALQRSTEYGQYDDEFLKSNIAEVFRVFGCVCVFLCVCLHVCVCARARARVLRASRGRMRAHSSSSHSARLTHKIWSCLLLNRCARDTTKCTIRRGCTQNARSWSP